MSQDESASEAHRLYRAVPGHEPRHGAMQTDSARSDDRHPVNGVVAPASTGVMYVSERAAANGWSPLNEGVSTGRSLTTSRSKTEDLTLWRWGCSFLVRFFTSGPTSSVKYTQGLFQQTGTQPLTTVWVEFLQGQGAPEVGDLPGAPPRPQVIDMSKMASFPSPRRTSHHGADVHEYAPTTGVRELRAAVAHLYNETHRKGKTSQYTADNVAIVPGGRAGLTRVASIIGEVYVSYQVPEYTAYDQMLSSFRKLVPIPSMLDEEDAYHLNIDKLKKNIKNQGLSVVVASNPRNPTGQVIHSEELEQLVDLGRQGTTIILDEFYSMYQYELGEGAVVSAAKYVEDVEKDSVIIIDGLTKNWRLPGWRVAWVIGPKALVTALGSVGGYLDGGANHVLQVAAIPLMEPSRVEQDRLALQRHFKAKRDHVLERLERMGLPVKHKPTSTFYIWLDLSCLPAPLDGGLVFFEECLKERVIVTPGIFFDLNPAVRRNLHDSPCHHFVRLSYGPPLEEIDRGLDAIERLLNRVRKAIKGGDSLFDHVDKDLKQ
ncbi:BQ5605_C016g08146 [Microbotryum silenes-dioicae]|uniref:BQ5605_C016g08146 protein n=1 Tax=Microbotryum silenes-dioicae TaxID=796604 RepID=A0A2X0NT18_9BASI|nr:BQ5605_C016g08146 [Microbotryum silenes-dioicae]